MHIYRVHSKTKDRFQNSEKRDERRKLKESFQSSYDRSALKIAGS